MFASLPSEVYVSTLLALCTPDILCVSLTSRDIRRSFQQQRICDGQAEDTCKDDAVGGVLKILKVFACISGLSSEHRPRREISEGFNGSIYLHSLGLPLSLCGAYCRAMRRISLVAPVRFASADEIKALIASHRRLVVAKSGSSRGSMLTLEQPFGSMKLTGELRTIREFDLELDVERRDVDLATEAWRHICSQWCWVDIPKLGRAPSEGAAPLRLGIQLHTQGSCSMKEFLEDGLRLDVRCAVKGATTECVFLQMCSAVPGLPFELAVAARNFDACDPEDEGWYFPREECVWRSLSPYQVKCIDEEKVTSIGATSGEAPSLLSWPLKVRVLFRAYSAVRAGYGTFETRMR